MKTGASARTQGNERQCPNRRATSWGRTLQAGVGATGPPVVPCTPGVGRDVYLVDLIAQQFFTPRIPMTCDQVAEAEESWAARRAGTTPQYYAEDIEIITVPEPGTFVGLASGWLGLAALVHRRRVSRARYERSGDLAKRRRMDAGPLTR